MVILAICFGGCIGTDEVEDPIVAEAIELDREQLGLLIGSSAEVSATFFNQYGVPEDVQLLWSSSNEDVATVDIAGLVTAEGVGQANLTCAVGNTTSPPLLVTVVENEGDVAQVTLSSPAGNQISIGQKINLEVDVFNLLGEPIDGFDASFASLDPDLIAVNQAGVATGVSNGVGRVVATVEGIQSNAFEIQIGPVARTGVFVGANGYDASGGTELFVADNGDLMLRLNDNFDTDFALGTFIYLSNSTAGNTTRNEGLEIQEISTGGTHVFNVTELQPSVGIDDFNYVVVLCKPATITFGYAQLN